MLIAMVIDGDHVMVRDVIYCSRFFQNWHSPELLMFAVLSATRLTVATQQTFLQVSQSGYTNVIDGHAYLQSLRVKIILSSERFGLVR